MPRKHQGTVQQSPQGGFTDAPLFVSESSVPSALVGIQ